MTRTAIARALAALALSALACVNTAPAGAPTAEQVLAATTRAEMLRITTVEPLRCPVSRDGWEICVWQFGDRNAAWYALAQTLGTRYRVNVICEFPNGGGARERECVALPAVSPPTQGRSPQRLPTSPAEAQAQLDAARTVWELSALVGDAPARCNSVEERSRFCVWEATNRTKGFATLLPLLEKRARLQLSCTLPADGSPREPGSCRAQPF